eukprot:EW704969.1.p4 GENE.EW704969.1~~EW704969.1.p4  ORF type:complete len:57 (-),score=10.69 EW704969.1:209-379(-)
MLRAVYCVRFVSQLFVTKCATNSFAALLRTPPCEHFAFTRSPIRLLTPSILVFSSV